MEYNFREIEKKWQNIWEQEKRFEVKNHEPGKKNCYVLIEFPYPSGKGLHTGHVRSYSAMDAVARKKRFEGYNILFPMGCDSFGLEAERTAIKEKKLPQQIVSRNIAIFKEQLKEVGLSVDWSREISTCDPDYYKWTQWQFIQFFKHGLAEKKEILINWCPNCGVLANEEVEDGKCCQCHSQVVQKPKSQWIFKMTKYGQRLNDDLDQTEYPDYIKVSQRNWIGMSHGTQVKFKLTTGGEFEIYTTCIETIYGITFVVFAPDGQLVKDLMPYITNKQEVERYIKQTSKKSVFERSELNKDKTGCLLEGVKAINPINNKQVPIYLGDFVLADYGTGAAMAVPAHDQRDYDFAKALNIDGMIEVIKGGDITKQAFEKRDYLGHNCTMVNSGEFDGQTVEEAKQNIFNKLHKMGVAQKTTNFKMRDWIFSRQRYWGEPIPMVYCEKCGWQPVDEKDLPVTLPKVDSYEPTKDGQSPLSLIPSFVNTTCPRCGGKAKRETDTMPGWAGSSWYYMRYCDPKNDKEFASMDALKAWLPVDIYNGGNEHINRHVLFARFWNKFLYDNGLSPVSEPFKRRVGQGIVLGSNGVKMSKSLGNVVDPRDMIKQYGADALRVWESFMGEYTASVNWSDDGVKACHKFLTRIWNLQDVLVDDDKIRPELEFSVNMCIDKVTNDINAYKFNTAISALMILLNDIYKVGNVTKGEYKTLLVLLNPFAPHITEEIWQRCNFSPKLQFATWPKADKSKMVKDEVEIVVQVLSKIKGKLIIKNNMSQQEVVDLVKKNYKEIDVDKAKKVIYIQNKLINFII